MKLTKQTSYRFIIGGQITPEHVERIAKNFSKIYGGITVIHSTGYWSEQGEEWKDNYDNILTEPGAAFELVTPYDLDLDVARDCFNPVVGIVNWIHFESKVVDTCHFQLNEVLQPV